MKKFLRALAHTLTWQACLIYVIFLASYGALLVVGYELHWKSAFAPFSLTSSADGKLIGVSGLVGSSNRTQFYLFDEKLNLVRQSRLKNIGSIGRHGLSSDGKFVLNVAGGLEELVLEIISLDSHHSPVIVHAPIAYNGIAFLKPVVDAANIRLIGTPPSLAILNVDHVTYLMDMSGRVIQKIESNPVSTSDSSEYVALIEGGWDELPFYITCYEASSDGFKPVFKELQPWKYWRDVRSVVFENRRLAIQQESSVRIIDLSDEIQPHREKTIPWPRTDGLLEGMSPNGQFLLFKKSNSELFVLSSETAQTVGHLSSAQESYVHPQIADNRVLTVESNDDNFSLMTWDWRDSSIHKRPFVTFSPLNQFAANWIFRGCCLIWGMLFFAVANKRRSMLFAMTTVFATLSILLYHAHLDRDADNLVLLGYQPLAVTLMVGWQIVLSLISVWGFRYLSFTIASSLSVCSASAIGYLFHSWSADGNNLFSTIFVIFGFAMMAIQGLLLVTDRHRRRLSLSSFLILIASIAISVRLSLLADVGGLTTNWALIETGTLNTHNSNWRFSSIADGAAYIVLTMLAVWLSKLRGWWLVTIPIQICLLICLIVVMATNADTIFNSLQRTFTIGLTLASSCGFVITWTILSLVYRCFEAASDRNIATRALHND